MVTISNWELHGFQNKVADIWQIFLELYYIHREIVEIVREFGGQRGGNRYISLPSDRQTRGFVSAFSRWIHNSLNWVGFSLQLAMKYEMKVRGFQYF